MRALLELAGVIVAGFGAFFGGIAVVLGFLFLWLCGLASALCLMVAVFAGVMYWITGTPHDGQLALIYLGYASVPFALTFIIGYYRSKFGQTWQERGMPRRFGEMSRMRGDKFVSRTRPG